MSSANPPLLPTDFAPAERASQTDLERVVGYFIEHPESFSILDSVPELVLVLNAQRQVVYANSAAAELLHVDDTSSLIGLRPGELLGCEHAFENAGGCGTTKHCSACGTVRSIMDSLAGHRSVNECHLNRAGMEASFDLRVWGDAA